MKPLGRQLSSLLAERIRFIRFALVGGSGVLVNILIFEVLLWVLEGISSRFLQVNMAAIGGFALSFCSNFILNHYWTWGDRTQDSGVPVSKRFLSYFTVACSALLVQIVVLNILSEALLPRYANILGIGAGTVINFAVNHFWTFGEKSDETE